MKKKVLLVFVALALLLTIALTGCSGSGIAQADYDSIVARLNQALDDLKSAQNEKAAADSALRDTRAQVTDLEKQIADLKAMYEFTGDSLADIAAKIVANYHATHVYSKTDMFICGDMSSEVWNMLKAQGISSVIVIGNPDAAVTDILQSNHAWVLADVGNGEKLALETTAGTVVPRSQNVNYYRGWSFSSPTDLKANNDWIKEYNLRVEFRNLLANEVNAAINLYNNASTQAEADKYFELYNKLKEMKEDQEAILIQLQDNIDGLAARF